MAECSGIEICLLRNGKTSGSEIKTKWNDVRITFSSEVMLAF